MPQTAAAPGRAEIAVPSDRSRKNHGNSPEKQSFSRQTIRYDSRRSRRSRTCLHNRDYERSQCTRLVAGCRVREFRRLEHQHRQRLLRRTSIHAVDVGCIQTGKRTGPAPTWRRRPIKSPLRKQPSQLRTSARGRYVASTSAGGGTTPDSTTSAPSSEDSAGDTVTVSEGDTLFDLASAKGFRWQDVWARNALIPDPDQIRVGDVIQF